MPGFEAEYYLRCAAEDALRSHRDSSTGDRARALVAIGLLSRAHATAVLHAYGRARELRGLEHEPDEAGPVSAPEERRICGSTRVIEQPWGTVRLRYISLSANRTEVAAVVDLKSDADRSAVPSAVRRRPGGRPSGFYGRPGPPELRITDDAGHAAEAGFNGNGSDEQWRGSWSVQPGLPPGTAWIELFGTRIELSEVAAPKRIQVEYFDLDNESIGARAERHLEHRLEATSHWGHHANAMDAVIETLIAGQALPADSPVVTRTRAIADVLGEDASGPAHDLSPRWQSVLDPPRRRAAAARSILVGVTTPEFDGQYLSVMDLQVSDDGFEFDFQGVGALAQNSRAAGLDAVLLTFTASDDRSNHYLGRLGSHGCSGSDIEGTVKFTPPLAADATQLDLAFTTDRARVTISLALPRDERP